MHDICLHTQLSRIYIDINIVEIDERKDMGESREFKKSIFYFYFLNINISLNMIV